VLYSVSVIGRDRPGIVAGISGVLLELDGNIDDSQMSILHGHFAVMLVVSVPDSVPRARLASRLEDMGRSLGMSSVVVSELDRLSPVSTPSHVLSVYGADHPGIVYAVAEALAAHGANITDMRTRRTGDSEDPVYVMFLELELRGDADAVAGALKEVGREAGVEVSLRELTREDL
jgi:glycine cleavage system transcriptional repressor